MTQSELADRMKMHVNQIANWEKNKAFPRADALASLSKELQVSMDFLAGLVDDPEAHFQIEDLSAKEQRFIDTLRRGEVLKLLYEISTDEELAEKVNKKP